jgi:hypothetical protein
MTIGKTFLLTLWAIGFAVYGALTLVRGCSTRISPVWNARLKWIAPFTMARSQELWVKLIRFLLFNNCAFCSHLLGCGRSPR